MNKTKMRTMLGIVAASALIAGCGSGGGGGAPGDSGSSSGGSGGSSSGGGKPTGASASAATKQVPTVKKCITKKAKGSKVAEGKADLLPAQAAAEVLVVTFPSGNKANVAFFADEQGSKDANSNAKNGKLSFRDGKIVTAYAKTPADSDRDPVKDCVPDEDKDKEDPQQSQ